MFVKSRAVEELMLPYWGMDLWCAAGLLLENLVTVCCHNKEALLLHDCTSPLW